MGMENRYDKYKDSGIAWIGEIPEHWGLVSIGKLFNVYAGGDAKPNYYSDIKDLEHPFPVYTNTRSEFEVYAYTSKAIFPANTITVTGRGDVGHAIYRKTPYDAIIRLLSLIPRDNYDCKFYTYFIDIVIPFMDGKSAVAQLSALQLKPQIVCFPPNKEQQSIATYLDKKCGEIDELITLQEEMITKLQSYKQSVITEAVTKGLNKNVPLKDSGIEWMGEIPEHWNIYQLKRCSKFINGYAFNSNHFNKDKGIPVIRIGDIKYEQISFENIVYVQENYELEKFIVHKNDILIAMSGATVGKIGIYSSDDKVYINQRVGIIRATQYNYIKRMFSTNGFIDYINLSSAGSAQPNISSDGILNFNIPVPPINEQQSIATYLDQKCFEIDELISIKQQKIEKLKDYKKSLIFECVTGKRKV